MAKVFVKGHKHSVETKNKIGSANTKQVYFNCDLCGLESSDAPSVYKRNKLHFCSSVCYGKYVSEKMELTDRNAYKGVRKPGETKQVYHRNYCKKNPENIAHLKARRYAREKNATGSHSLPEWNTLKAKFNHKCAICGESKPLTKDHIIPLSEGGSDFINNIQPLCKNCNSKKWKFIYENKELITH